MQRPIAAAVASPKPRAASDDRFLFLRHSAENGDDEAQFRWGMEHIRAKSGELKNLSVGMEWVEKACEQGNADAIFFMALMCLSIGLLVQWLSSGPPWSRYVPLLQPCDTWNGTLGILKPSRLTDSRSKTSSCSTKSSAETGQTFTTSDARHTEDGSRMLTRHRR